MFRFIRKLFGATVPVDYRALLKEGGRIIDVRSSLEYKSGHIQRSINLPLEELLSGMRRIDKHKPIIVCCASGRRSGIAKSVLMKIGYSRVYNGGSWTSLQRKIR